MSPENRVLVFFSSLFLSHRLTFAVVLPSHTFVSLSHWFLLLVSSTIRIVSYVFFCCCCCSGAIWNIETLMRTCSWNFEPENNLCSCSYPKSSAYLCLCPFQHLILLVCCNHAYNFIRKVSSGVPETMILYRIATNTITRKRKKQGRKYQNNTGKWVKWNDILLKRRKEKTSVTVTRATTSNNNQILLRCGTCNSISWNYA